MSQQLDSDRITVRPAPGTIQVYKGASWSDAPPDLVQTALYPVPARTRHIWSTVHFGTWLVPANPPLLVLAVLDGRRTQCAPVS